MITVKAYLYPNTVEVQFFDPSIFTVRNRVVYSRPIKVYQGIDNPIQVIVKNQDQKKADLTGYAMQADIQDPTNKITVMSYAVTWANIQMGLGQFTIDSTTLNSLEQRFYKLTFRTILRRALSRDISSDLMGALFSLFPSNSSTLFTISIKRPRSITSIAW